MTLSANSSGRHTKILATVVGATNVLKKREEYAVNLRKKKNRDFINLKRKKMAYKMIKLD